MNGLGSRCGKEPSRRPRRGGKRDRAAIIGRSGNSFQSPASRCDERLLWRCARQSLPRPIIDDRIEDFRTDRVGSDTIDRWVQPARRAGVTSTVQRLTLPGPRRTWRPRPFGDAGSRPQLMTSQGGSGIDVIDRRTLWEPTMELCPCHNSQECTSRISAQLASCRNELDVTGHARGQRLR